MSSNRKMRAFEMARLVCAYFSSKSEERLFARTGLVTILIASVSVVMLQVWINTINGNLFTALQNRDVHGFFDALLHLAGAILLLIGVWLGRLFAEQTFELRWRRWLTTQYVKRYTDNATLYRMRFLNSENTVDNPDQRIAEDVKKLTSGTLDIFLGLFQSSISLASFATLLWTLSGSVEIPLWYDWQSSRFTSWEKIPGYLLGVAVLYEVVATFIAIRIGRCLIGLNNTQQAHEADFRYGLVRLREDAEAAALLGGSAAECDHAIRRFQSVYRNGMRLIIANGRYSSFRLLSTQVTSYLPYFVAAPRYFMGGITLGEFIQINGAFSQVDSSLAWITRMFPAIADWRATVDRLIEFNQAIDECHQAHNSLKQASSEAPDNIALASGLSLHRPSGEMLFRVEPERNPNGLLLVEGENIVLTGASGSGKSTLLRAIAGFWPHRRGEIRAPATDKSLFLPQRPYLPFGVTLREALWYPKMPASLGNSMKMEASLLYELGLESALPALENGRISDWCKELSLGEQQRLSLARAVLLQPRWLFLDEPFSAMDDMQRGIAMRVLSRDLSKTTIVCVAHTIAQPALMERRHLVLRREGIAFLPASITLAECAA